MRGWTAVAHFGSPLWEGHDFILTRGPRWWCRLRAELWLLSNQFSRVHITPLRVYLDDAGKVQIEASA